MSTLKVGIAHYEKMKARTMRIAKGEETAVIENVVRKPGGAPILGTDIRSQADLAMAVQRRLPLASLKGLSSAGLSEQEIERFVIPQRTRLPRASDWFRRSRKG